ncbi:MAG: ATPase, T2SS/T4P/T4SS family [Candidatus Taylorbacteria bacterium]|nr:ATPase, T2SS/T4P/T4SS family [Candidatus Taylorbacteria bacterium]
MKIVDILVKKHLISREDAEAIETELSGPDASLESVLISHGVDPKEILIAKGEYLGIPTSSLGGKVIPSSILEYIPEDAARHYHFVPIAFEDSTLHVGIVDPDNIDARDALQFITSHLDIPYKIFLISDLDFDKAIEMYRGLSGEVIKALDELETELTKEEKKKEDKDSEVAKQLGHNTSAFSEDAPVVKIVTTIIRYATDGNASDVHIEPMSDKVRVRFRVDGVLNTSITLPAHVHSAVVARIKVVANMKLDERRLPQDGRFSVKIDNRKVDFRVSTFPTYYGEKVEMRILDQDKAVKKIEEMGLTEKNVKMIKAAIDKPYGLILITGPTGSGKSTTLYSMLQEMDREKDNILSLEDPIEYNIEGINQSQVRPEIGYTFANGLRTTLRQDPDIIMVGEIRDKETAQLAIQAALTGHLVLSTLHTNNSAGVVPRLIDMGVDPYLIAPTLICAIAQRLVLTLAPGSGTEVPVEGSLKVMLEKQFSDLPPEFKKEIPFSKFVYEASPTPDCPTGLRGRTAAMEVFMMDKDIERAILSDASELNLQKILRSKGMLSLKEDAIIKAFRKEIPFEEVAKL